MDLSLTGLGDSYRITARSVLGMLWLQTHFDASDWDSVCSGRARLHTDGVSSLCRDARQAGLQVTQASA